ncbi:MAG: hypothetical protein JSR17_07300 [Proteobacteria bacterium]|nr:hypothetical protein [Pseudomonadota bacterium]
MKQKLIFVFLLLQVLCTLGCGFHLRHSQAELSKKYPTIVLVPSGSNTLHQGLSRALIASSVQVSENTENISSPRLAVVSQNLTTQPLVYGPDSELRRERLKMSVVFSFGDKEIQQFELETERDRQLNPNQHLGDNAEKVVIEREMQADIISQLLRYLATKQY